MRISVYKFEAVDLAPLVRLPCEGYGITHVDLGSVLYLAELSQKVVAFLFLVWLPSINLFVGSFPLSEDPHYEDYE